MNLMYLSLFSLLIFGAGLYAVLSRTHLIAMLIGIELMLNASSLNFLVFNQNGMANPVIGQIIVLFIIGLAAAEVAIALAIVLALYRQRHRIHVDDLNSLKG